MEEEEEGGILVLLGRNILKEGTNCKLTEALVNVTKDVHFRFDAILDLME